MNSHSFGGKMSGCALVHMGIGALDASWYN